ncbi:MAG: glycosyltransferase family 4 protein [Cyanobacteria bacterium J06649_4]
MKVLFLHPNFPAQFRHIATVLGADPNNQVVYITACVEGQIPGVRKFLYKTTREVSAQTHRYVRPLESSVANGQAVWRTAYQLKDQLGFEPDVVYAHVGWGVGLFIRDLFPKAAYMGFFEWYYHATGSDVDFDPSDPPTEDDAAKLHIRNASILLDLVRCDAGIVPTQWQKQQFPPEFHSKLHVLHDGINLEACKPKANIKLTLPPSKDSDFAKNGLDLPVGAEIVTYVARGMEPYRGFPQMMAAVEQLQKMRSHCHMVIVGEDWVAYGSTLPDGQTYRQKALDELDLDLSRVHFTGSIPYSQLHQVYQASSVHLYLTYPFVLSWSMLEAMAAGCVVLGSKTPPVEEVIVDGENGFLVDFWDVEAIASKLNELLENQASLGKVRQKARQTIADRYDLAQLLPQQMAFLKKAIRAAQS